MRLIDFFDRGRMLSPGGTCIASDSEHLSYDAAWEASHRIARGILDAGFEPGDHAAVLGGNEVRTFVAILALLRAGIVWVPLNPKDSNEVLAHVLNSTDCRLVLHANGLASTIASLAAQCPKVDRWIAFESSADGDDLTMRDMETGAFERVEIAAKPTDISRMPITGGTTGLPKAAVRSHLSDTALVASFLAFLPPDHRPRYLMAAPISHAAGGMAFPHLALGGSIQLVVRAEPEAVMKAIEDHAITSLFLPPTSIYDILNHPRAASYDLSSLRYLYYGAAPITPERIGQAQEFFGGCLVQLYGQTEAPIVATVLTLADHEKAATDETYARLRESVGRPGPLARVEIMDIAEDRLLPPGETGEIVIRSNLAIERYYNQPEATAALFRDGWVATGDVGHKDEEGYVYLTDRKKDMIITGGFNVYPAEVEKALLAHPDIAQCGVVGVSEERWGEEVVACVEPIAGAKLDAASLIAFCKARIGSVKSPKRIAIVEAMPRTAAGKVDKAAIRREFDRVGDEAQAP